MAMTLLEVKTALRNGTSAWPGGYPLFFVTHDGAALSFAAVRAEWRNVVQDHLWTKQPGFRGTGWLLEAVDVNYEDPELFCDYTGERIPSAYVEPENAE
jgi:hypothetical protein